MRLFFEFFDKTGQVNQKTFDFLRDQLDMAYIVMRELNENKKKYIFCFKWAIPVELKKRENFTVQIGNTD